MDELCWDNNGHIYHPILSSSISTSIHFLYGKALVCANCTDYIFFPFDLLLHLSGFPALDQRRRLAFAKEKYVISGILKHIKKCALGRICTEEGEPNVEVLQKLFRVIDDNKNGSLSPSELRALIVGIRFGEINLEEDDVVKKVMKDFDTTRDCKIEFSEFVNGVRSWLDEAKGARVSSLRDGPETMKYLDDFHEVTKVMRLLKVLKVLVGPQ